MPKHDFIFKKPIACWPKPLSTNKVNNLYCIAWNLEVANNCKLRLFPKLFDDFNFRIMISMISTYPGICRNDSWSSWCTDHHLDFAGAVYYQRRAGRRHIPASWCNAISSWYGVYWVRFTGGKVIVGHVVIQKHTSACGVKFATKAVNIK